ncbi:MAG: PDZ domain-containing protein [Acidobacteria bacterium]|nr:PDZ domain-containing protein [Acidobacteriota bacterium]
MSSTTRRVVLWMSAPVVTVALVGGVLSRVIAREDTYQHLKIFDEVVNLISNNYVEKVDIDKVMAGAMHGLAESLDPDSAFVTPAQARQIETDAALPPGNVGIDLTRQGYLRIIAARDGSPAAKAGLMTGDYVRIIGETPTRDMSVFDGMRALAGPVGSRVSLTIIRDNANEPHVVELTREPAPTADVTGRMAAPGVGYLRIASVSPRTAEQAQTQIASLTKTGATSLIVDVRRASGGSLDGGLALARLFVATGTLAHRESKGVARETIAARAGDGGVTLPMLLLVDIGTSSGAELFVAALVGNKRAESVGEHTIGRAALQKLIKLPNGSGLWLTVTRYLAPDGSPLHEKGLEPTVAVDEPSVGFGQAPPAGDPVLEKALERIAQKKAA